MVFDSRIEHHTTSNRTPIESPKEYLMFFFKSTSQQVNKVEVVRKMQTCSHCRRCFSIYIIFCIYTYTT